MENNQLELHITTQEKEFFQKTITKIKNSGYEFSHTFLTVKDKSLLTIFSNDPFVFYLIGKYHYQFIIKKP
jgi:hypothetical protein